MYQKLDERIARLVSDGGPSLAGGLRGLEKEALRVTPDGRVAQTPHPRALGAALTHPWITTDYSEALLEFVTPPFPETGECLAFLENIHRYVYSHLPAGELLWATSMPCIVEGDRSIPIARYGTSNSGLMKHVYRQGLGHRYGRAMQAISGIHFNYSLPEAFWDAYVEQEQRAGEVRAVRDESYFALLRNYWRYGWILLYLFGASPAVCKSFLRGRDRGLPEFDASTRFGPEATSLRMSDLGYRNTNQASVHLSPNSLDDYLAGLEAAMSTPFPAYERIGTLVDGEWRQLSTNVLQIENEYYGYVRPKQIARSGERPSRALRREGVRYVEVRALDVNPFEPCGLGATDVRFLETFLIFCLLHASERLSESEAAALENNHSRVAVAGRRAGLQLRIDGRTASLCAWGRELLTAMVPVAELLDGGSDGPFGRSVADQMSKVEDPECTPSARVLDAMSRNHASFFEFAMAASQQQRDEFLAKGPLPDSVEQRFDAAAEASLDDQSRLEAASERSFGDFLAQYYA
jgi:glutamate--cysteine ligase